MKYKLIATDLDGTLGTDEHEITPENKQAALRIMDLGMKIVICSGRSPASLIEVTKTLEIKDPYIISFNGGFVLDVSTGTKLLESRMKIELAEEILKNLKPLTENIELVVYTEPYEAITETGTEIAPYAFGYAKINIEPKDDLAEALENDVLKIILIGDRVKLEFIYKEMEPLVADKCGILFTGSQILEFVPPGVNKGEALKFLAKYLGISMEEVVAFGDNYNDMEMLKEAGLGVAVANAVTPLKNTADFVTCRDNNNSAFSELVDYILSDCL